MLRCQVVALPVSRSVTEQLHCNDCITLEAWNIFKIVAALQFAWLPTVFGVFAAAR